MRRKEKERREGLCIRMIKAPRLAYKTRQCRDDRMKLVDDADGGWPNTDEMLAGRYKNLSGSAEIRAVK